MNQGEVSVESLQVVITTDVPFSNPRVRTTTGPHHDGLIVRDDCSEGGDGECKVVFELADAIHADEYGRIILQWMQPCADASAPECSEHWLRYL